MVEMTFRDFDAFQQIVRELKAEQEGTMLVSLNVAIAIVMGLQDPSSERAKARAADLYKRHCAGKDDALGVIVGKGQSPRRIDWISLTTKVFPALRDGEKKKPASKRPSYEPEFTRIVDLYQNVSDAPTFHALDENILKCLSYSLMNHKHPLGTMRWSLRWMIQR